MTPETELSKWLRSPEGQRQMAEAAAKSKADLEKLNDARRIDPAELNKPMDI